MNGWTQGTLSHICAFRAGSGFPQIEQGASSGFVPFIKVSDLSRLGNEFRIATAKNWLTRDQFERLNPTTAPAHSSVFAKIGEGLRSERVRLLSQPTAIDNNLMAAVPHRPDDDRYLYYLLRTVGLAQHAVGSALPYLKQSSLLQIPVSIPDPAERHAIAAVLGVLDEKITSNVALVETSVALSRARYQSVPKEVALPLSSLARFVNGKAFTKGATGAGRVVIRIAELNSGLGGSTVYNDIEVPEDHLARPGDLLFAWSGSLTVHRWHRPEAIINQHIFKVVPHRNYPMWLVHQALLGRLDDFKAIASDKATTMGHIQRHNLDEPVMIPAQAVVAQENALMRDLWQMALAADVENLILAELRDTLLPALMSGRLRVKDAERQVEDAV